MADRIIELKKVPIKQITNGGFDWYLEQDDYLVAEGIVLEPEEIDDYVNIANEAYQLYEDITDRIIREASWDHFPFPTAMREMIQHSWDRKDVHLLSRFDLSGGIDGMQSKVYELNADTPTMLPETVVFQSLFKDETRRRKYVQFNKLRLELSATFEDLLEKHPYRENTLLVTSLGHEEDILNAQVIMEIAKLAGFTAEYANLESVVFEDDGVYLEYDDDSDQRFDYMFKLVPWEYIMYEEPELLEILRDLQIRDKVYIMNPAYTAIMQSKAILPYLYANSKEDYVLKSSFDKSDFKHESYVEKVVFGRLGENVNIVDKYGDIIANNDGDYGSFPKIYQAFSPLFQDEDEDYYQPGIYIVNQKAVSISFRRCESLIVNDDCEFIPHFIAQ